MHAVEFIPAEWLERSAWAAHCGQRLQVYSRAAEIERRVRTRRTADVGLLLQSLLLEKAA
jgi:hypothetical protein